MFNSKQTNLFNFTEQTSESTVEKDPFIRSCIETDVIPSGNLSDKLKTTGSDFVDQFASASRYRSPRTHAEISADMESLWGKNPLLALKLTVYFRLITRVCKFTDGSTTESVQIGQGLIHESIMRMLWLIINHPKVFIANVNVFIAAGSWKDFITMMKYDAMYNGYKHSFDWDILIQLLVYGLINPETTDLVRKYLPTIRSKKQCKTIESQADNIVGKAICHKLFGNKDQENPGKLYKMYRIVKIDGSSHEWQQLISQRRFLEINFDTIAGRALFKLVNSNFLENQGLIQKYEEWILNQPVAKYTGYVYELFTEVITKGKELPSYKKHTVNAQFRGLVEKAKQDMAETDRGLLCVLDTSGSMSSPALGTDIKSYDVAKTMTLFFSELLEGRFHGHYFEFSSSTILRTFKGPSPVDKYLSTQSRITENTNFSSVFDKLIEIRKQGVLEEDFPSGILCISDGEFDYSYKTDTIATEIVFARKKLLAGGFSEKFVENFKIILWDIPNSYYGKPVTKFEALADDSSAIHIGGLDGSVIQFLIGKKEKETSVSQLPKTSEELFLAAMDQEILAILQV